MTDVNNTEEPEDEPSGEPQPRREPPGMDSTGYVGVGLSLTLIAGIVLAITLSRAQSDGRFDGGADPAFGLLMTLAFALPGSTFFMIGVVAKGVAMGNRES